MRKNIYVCGIIITTCLWPAFFYKQYLCIIQMQIIVVTWGFIRYGRGFLHYRYVGANAYVDIVMHLHEQQVKLNKKLCRLVCSSDENVCTVFIIVCECGVQRLACSFAATAFLKLKGKF